MAATLTNSSELTYLSFPITKFEKNADGDLVVYGKATDGSVDSDEQIVDSDFSSKAIQDWLSSGANVRVQHNSQRDPAGIGIEANTDADGATWVKTLVIEPVAQRLVEKGALRAYSVGIARPKIVRDGVARGGRIVDGQIVEISLVDRPANKNCGIQLVKSADNGEPEWVGKLWGVDDESPRMITKSITKTTTTTYEMPEDISGAFSPADMAKLLGIKKDLEAETEKRKMDPDVGGGVDRDKIPGADFAGRNRSFPIVTPGDVSDAASSIGRAGSDNFSSDQLKANIIRIARRKGASFVAELPQAWKDEMNTKSMTTEASSGAEDDSEDDNTPTSDMTGNTGSSETSGDGDDEATKGKKAFPGAAPAFDGTDSDGDGADTDKPGSHLDDDGTEAKVKPGSSKKSMDEELFERIQKGLITIDEARQELGLAPVEAVKGAAEVEEPDVEKRGAKACPKCGKNYHADSKQKTCENCGTKLPKADKSIAVGAKVTELFGVDVSSLSPEAAKALTEAVFALKGGKSLCPGCGANIHTKHAFCPECGGSMAKAKPIGKNHDFTCLGCGKKQDKGEKFCPGCGKGNPGYLPEADNKIKGTEGGTVEKGKPTPDGDAVGVGAVDIQPVPAHREPDGPFIESLESDMHIPTDPDGPYLLETKAARRIKNAGAPYDLGALHDLTCPGFHPADAMKCHPSVNFSTLDLGYWSEKADRAVYGGSFEDAKVSAELLRHAGVVKGLDQDTYFEHAINAHKSFRDANPGPANFPNPTEIKPGSFQRPFQSAGRAVPGTDYDGPNTHSVPQSSIDAAQFDRGYLTAGRAAQSPSNKASDIIAAPVPTGAPQRTFYTNAVRDNARQAMQTLHDHIAHTFPDLCPMGASGAGNGAEAGSRPVPTPVGAVKAAESASPVIDEKAARKAAKKARKAAEAAALAQEAVVKAAGLTEAEPVVENAEPEVAKSATVDADVIKSALTEVTGGLLEKLNELEIVLKAERKRNKKLEETVEAMASMADPRVQPFNAVSIAPPVLKSASPVGWSVAESAERTQAALMQALVQDARTNPDPSVRERAWAKLYEMNGI